jgi:hypothetical protein
MPAVYDELYKLANSYLRRERPGHTLQLFVKKCQSAFDVQTD